MNRRLALAAGAALFAATAASAQDSDGPRFCPTRPSLGSSPCTVPSGRVLVEASALDWQRDDRSDSREDRVLAADLLARIGVGATTEVQVGWTAFGHDRERDVTSGTVERTDGVGDVTLALRQHLLGGQTDGFSLGVQPYVTLPAGRYPIGAGTWAAGAVVPVQYDLGNASLQFTGEVDAAANGSGSGRHLAYSGIWGASYKLTGAVTVTGEVSLQRDRDPDGHETHALAALSAAWQPTGRTQLDLLAVAGLNRTSPDVRLVVGGAVLF